MALSFDPIKRAYRRVADTARALTGAALSKLRDALTSRDSTAADLAADVSSGRISVGTWESRVWTSVKRRHVAQYILGRGGRAQMTDEDSRRLETHLLAQRRYLRQFANDVRDGKLSEKAIASRTALYESASVTAFEQGQAGAWGIELPAYPGIGSECHSACRCHWSIKQVGNEVQATWRTNAGETCPTCSDRAVRYNPYVVKVVA